MALQKQQTANSHVYIGQMLVGFGLGWSAPIIPKLQNPELTPLPELITDGQASWIGSVLYVGAVIGPYVSTYISNKKGRKPSLMIGAILTICAFVMLSAASNLAMILTGRILTGLGIGIIAITNLVYIGEMASTNIRGILLTTAGIFNTFGTFIAYVSGPYVPYWALSFIGLVMTVFYCALLFSIPESPMFHLSKGDNTKAEQILTKLGREDEIYVLQKTKEELESQSSSQWLDLIRVKNNRKAFIITLTLFIFQQMSGLIVVMFFVTTIFEMAGSSIRPEIATIIIGGTQIFASCMAPLFVERVGRKALLLVSTGICWFSLATFGSYFFLDHINHSIVSSIQWIPLVSLIVYFLANNMGFGVIPGTLVGEMFETNVCIAGSTVTITISWAFGFILSTAFGYAMSHFGGHIVFWFFSISCACAFCFTAVYVPETKGKSLAEIQEILKR